MKEILDSRLIKDLVELPKLERDVILKEQGIENFYNYHVLGLDVGRLKYKNAIFLDIAKKITATLSEQKIVFCFIKGIALLEDFYPTLRDRELSDIDLLVHEVDFERVITFIEKAFEIESISRGTWIGDGHKAEIEIKGDFSLNITLELHSKLYWHQKQWGVRNISHREGVNIPNQEDHFIYLIYHYAFQHNCQKLYWLFDIIIFYQKYVRELDWGYINSRVTELEIRRSALFVKKILSNEFRVEMNELIGQTRIPFFRSNLLSAHQRDFYYLFLKFSLKDHFVKQGLLYLMKWLKRLK